MWGDFSARSPGVEAYTTPVVGTKHMYLSLLHNHLQIEAGRVGKLKHLAFRIRTLCPRTE